VGDVANFHADAANRLSTFQVASQFNCLEFISPNSAPEQGITRYVKDKTQDPACAIACGPATAYRNYLAEVDGQLGQRRNHQINNLSKLIAKLGDDGKYLNVKNGYTSATDEQLQSLNELLETIDQESLIDALCTGVHQGVQVTSTDWGRNQLRDQNQIVTQVLASACSVAYSSNPKELWEPFARLVLTASYEALFWAGLQSALLNGKQEGSCRIFLACLGGSAFGNELPWIVDAMDRVFTKFQNTALEVYIVTYSGEVASELQSFEGRFKGD